MNYFAKLPLKFRIVVVLCFLAASIVVGILGRPSLVLLLASVLLFLAGGWRISRARSFVLMLILVPALVGLLLTHFDWHHPFLSRYCAGLFSVIAVLLLMDGVRIEEWIEMVRGKEGGLPVSGLGPLLIGTAVGTISLASNIREQRACRKLANIYAWKAKSRTSIFLDSIALPFYNAVESHEFIDEALHRWGAHDAGPVPGAAPEIMAAQELTFGNSNFTVGLSDVTDFPFFADAMTAVLATVPIPKPWIQVISELAAPARVLDIGDGTALFATYLLERGFDVTVLVESQALDKALRRLPQPCTGLKVLEESFSYALVGECDHVFFHHASFLEAINQLGMRDVLERCHAISHAGARICFDYPATIMPGTQGAIFCGHVDNVGSVDYRYSQHEQDDDGLHRARLEYSIRQDHESFCVRAPVRFVAPALPDLLAAARDIGFSSSTYPMPGAFSFFAEEIVLVELQKRSLAKADRVRPVSLRKAE